MAGAPLLALADETNVDLARRVVDLASVDFSVRQRATQALEQAGWQAIPVLAAAAKSGDGEVRKRALAILSFHALSADANRPDAARAAMQELASAADSRVAYAASGA